MRRLALLACLLAPACGDGGPSSPSAPPSSSPPPVVVREARDGITDALVPGASIHAGPSSVSVAAAGYAPRLQAAAPVVWLWPQSPDYLGAIVYGWTGALMRWAGPTVRLGLDPAAGILDRGQLERAAAAMSAASGLEVVVAEPASVRVTLDPSLEDGGRARLELRGFEIVGALVRMQNQRAYEAMGGLGLVHELGHTLGLWHSPHPDDLLQADPWRLGGWTTFGPEETKALRMMYGRRDAGNRPPDTAPEVAAASAAGEATISCR